MERKLCPKCGAYWDCDCVIEPPQPLVSFEELEPPVDPSCEHDWLDAVGVELNLDLPDPDARVVVCRLCGAYAVKQPE